MNTRELIYIAVLVVVLGAVLARALTGQQEPATSRSAWQRKVFARILAVIALAIGVAVTYKLQSLH